MSENEDLEAVSTKPWIKVECPRCTMRFSWPSVDDPDIPGSYRDIVNDHRELTQAVWKAFLSGDNEQWMHAMNGVAKALHTNARMHYAPQFMDRYSKVCEELREAVETVERMTVTLEEATEVLDKQQHRIGRLRTHVIAIYSVAITLAIMLAVAVAG